MGKRSANITGADKGDLVACHESSLWIDFA
jgi:hypothetical protein